MDAAVNFCLQTANICAIAGDLRLIKFADPTITLNLTAKTCNVDAAHLDAHISCLHY